MSETLLEQDDPAAALVSINPANGDIRAMTAVIPGSKGNQFNLASQARRQAGSTFKTFVLDGGDRRRASARARPTSRRRSSTARTRAARATPSRRPRGARRPTATRYNGPTSIASATLALGQHASTRG